TTQVCTYDRAGMGYSEPGPLPRNAEQFAQELHTLLQHAGIPGPYVLAGHSLGGLPVRVFVHEYPTEVSGAVVPGGARVKFRRVARGPIRLHGILRDPAL
ncbi:MAG: alpha/beta fold hydrolase, partial [Anaerolineae bacterium]|nr:alpha/beta fold hydrolase [Anaerolineae bacterium]